VVVERGLDETTSGWARGVPLGGGTFVGSAVLTDGVSRIAYRLMLRVDSGHH